MKLDERHLVQLAAVLDAGGVTEGAASLGLTQPAVSRTLAQMERRLGEALFIKGRRPLQPTVLGRQLAQQGRVIREAARKASDTVLGYQRGTAGMVRLGGVPFFMDAFISRMIADFQNAEPEVRIDQSYGHLPDLTAQVQSGEIDLAICPVGVLTAGSGLTFEEIMPARSVVACRVGHPLLKQPGLKASDLMIYPWIAPLPGSPLLADLHAIQLVIGMAEINIRYSGGSLMSVMTYLAETNALTVLPHSVVFAFRSERRISALPVDIPQPDRSLGILRRADAARLPAADRFARHVVAGFSSLRQSIRRYEMSLSRSG